MPPVLLRLARTAARTGVAACVTLAAMALPALPAGAIGGLTVTPTTWDIIGLDSNNVTQGPNVFPTGQRVCNTTGAAMTGVSATLVFDSANANINLTSSPTIAIGTLAAGACAFPYFDITITRTSAAYDTARRYHVTVTADGGVTASSPLVRQLYVEHLVSQGRNAVASISGTTIVNPAPIPAAGTVYIGQQYKFTVNMSTATQGYAELFTPVSFPADIFRVNSMAITYSAPSGGTNDQPYADGCAWGQDPTVSTPTYRSCNGGSSSYVNHGGGMTVTYVVTVVAAGSGAVSAMVNDGSGSSFH
ncbi:MAG: hypothetical protein QOF57_2845 [Frankiaceae bacterium]|nr:hypothetical protein [Frankiaceae bacterium]